jgi:DNA-directed RNA polymerase subunit beta'
VPDINPKDLVAIRLKLASPEVIRSWSQGEVKRAETINYRTQKPERDGLFCEKIFGPVKDYECSCGKYKGKRYKGIICDRCGVEVTLSSVRRERMGHIELAVPVAHIWYYKVSPSIMGLLLDMTIRELEDVLYYDSYVVTDPGDTPLRKGQVLTEGEYRRYLDEYGEEFEADMGAPPLRRLLADLDLEEMSVELRTQIKLEKSPLRRSKILKKLRIVESFLNSGNRPEWMVLEVIPVIPPDLRPLVPLDGGRYATSDLNDLYRRVITRNNRLRNMIELNAPEIILRNEKRMLQEAVDALLDNSRRRRPVVGRGGRKLKSLSDILRGKKGLLRRNLLGKRVDYSGRSVIVVGPELKLNQVGLPKEMAIELFKPFVEHKLEESGLAESIRSARRLLQKRHEGVWELLENITKDHPVLLNRAPTLHRVSIQAFEPVLIEGKAIQIHPLVCTAYNADFDGDQMAVFVPISIEAQLESHLLLLAPNNILSPAHGKSLASPTQDMVLGLNYLTKKKPGAKREGKRFASVDEARIAYENGYIDLHAEIEVPIGGERLKTTIGRIIFNDIVPNELGFINEELDKKKIQNLVWRSHKTLGSGITTKFLDDLKEIGFKYASLSGLTFGLDDIIVPREKKEILKRALEERDRIEKAAKKGLISHVERYQKILDIWTRTTDRVKEVMIQRMKEDKLGFNPIYMMVNSGARGNEDQVRQLAGMRGLMARPTRSREMVGEFIETPIIANFKEGLSVLEYFISTHGSRKGLSDTALKTADAGHLTRRLVNVAQEVVISMEDCGTIMGRKMTALKEGETIIEPLKERIIGRVALEDVVDPVSGEIIVREGEEIDEEAAEKIENAGIESVEVRSVLRCEARYGVCAKCYGRNLATGRMVELGEAVGVMAAQSIGEPGTQLTLRTFHTGGAAERIAEEAYHIAPFSGKIEYHNLKVIERKNGERVSLSKKGTIVLVNGKRRRTFGVPYGAIVAVKNGQKVKEGDVICEWEPYALPILVTKRGKIHFEGLVEGITLKELYEEGRIERVVEMDRHKRYFPKAILLDEKNGEVVEEIYLVHDARLAVKEGEILEPGEIVARVPREAGKTRDITGGLPRVEELFEARSPKDKAIVAEVDGTVHIKPPEKGYFKVKIVTEVGDFREYDIPYGKYLLVGDGEKVEAGDPLTTGPVDPHDILRIKGKDTVQEFLLDQIQEVYRLSGVKIDDKHIEIIVRQMMRKVKIEDSGDTKFIQGDIVDLYKVQEENEKVEKKGGRPAQYKPVLLGITRSSLATDSFIAAASFQETTKVLASAAIAGKVDELRGLKENVIIGSLIPSGTGIKAYRRIKVEEEKEELEKEAKAAS